MPLFTWSNLIIIALNPFENGEMAVFNTQEEGLEKLKNYLMERYSNDADRKQAALRMHGREMHVLDNKVLTKHTLSGKLIHDLLKDVYFQDW